MKTSKKASTGGLSVTYVVVIAILVTIIFFALKKIGVKLPGKTPPAITTQEITITIEGTLGQPVAGAKAFLFTNNAGFMTLTYDDETAFVNKEGQPTTVSSLKSGNSIRAEGKPSGTAFEAKKVILLAEELNAKPTSSALPHTGITE